jgi:hypothetical protein
MLNFSKLYGVREARVGTYLPATELWDTSVDVPNLQAIKVTPSADNDEMMVYGGKEHGLAVIVGCEVTLDFAGIADTVVAAMTGISSSSSGSGASETRTRRLEGGDNLSYFGLMVKILADDGGDLHLYFPRCQLQSYFPLQMDKENKFLVPNVTAMAYRLRKEDGSLYPVIDMIEHATATSLATDFNSAFTALS